MTKIAEKINKKRETQLKQVENIYAKLLENKNPSPKTVLEPEIEDHQKPVQVISMDVNGTFVPSEEFANKESNHNNNNAEVVRTTNNNNEELLKKQPQNLDEKLDKIAAHLDLLTSSITQLTNNQTKLDYQVSNLINNKMDGNPNNHNGNNGNNLNSNNNFSNSKQSNNLDSNQVREISQNLANQQEETFRQNFIDMRKMLLNELTNPNSPILHSLKHTITIQVMSALKDLNFHDQLASSIDQIMISHFRQHLSKFDSELHNNIKNVPNLIGRKTIDFLNSQDFANCLDHNIAKSLEHQIRHQLKSTLNPIFANLQNLFNDGCSQYVSGIEDRLNHFTKQHNEKMVNVADMVTISLKNASVQSDKGLEESLLKKVQKPIKNLDASFNDFKAEQQQFNRTLLANQQKQANNQYQGKDFLNMLNEEARNNREESNKILQRIEETASQSLSNVSRSSKNNMPDLDNSRFMAELSNVSEAVNELQLQMVTMQNSVKMQKRYLTENSENIQNNILSSPEKLEAIQNQLKNDLRYDFQCDLKNELTNFSSSMESMCRNMVIQAQKMSNNNNNHYMQGSQMGDYDHVNGGQKGMRPQSTVSSMYSYVDYEKELKSELKRMITDKKYNKAFLKVLTECRNMQENEASSASSIKILLWLLQYCRNKNLVEEINTGRRPSSATSTGQIVEPLSFPYQLALLGQISSMFPHNNYSDMDLKFIWIKDLLQNIDVTKDKNLQQLQSYSLTGFLTKAFDDYKNSSEFDSKYLQSVKLCRILVLGLDQMIKSCLEEEEVGVSKSSRIDKSFTPLKNHAALDSDNYSNTSSHRNRRSKKSSKKF